MANERPENESPNDESNQIADSLNSVAYQLKRLGQGESTDHRGAVEMLAISVVEGAEKIAAAIESLAEAIRNH